MSDQATDKANQDPTDEVNRSANLVNSQASSYKQYLKGRRSLSFHSVKSAHSCAILSSNKSIKRLKHRRTMGMAGSGRYGKSNSIPQGFTLSDMPQQSRHCILMKNYKKMQDQQYINKESATGIQKLMTSTKDFSQMKNGTDSYDG